MKSIITLILRKFGLISAQAQLPMDEETARIKREGFEPPRKTTNNPELFAKDLTRDGWKCGGGVTSDGFRVIFRNDDVMYVQLEVWENIGKKGGRRG